MNTTKTNEATKTATNTTNEKKGEKTMNTTKNTTPANTTKTNETKGENTMKTAEKNTTPAAANIAPPALTEAEKIIAAAEREPLARRISAALDKAKTAATKDARAEAAEEAAALIGEYNEKSLANAAARASFIAAAEAVRVPAPKNAERREKGVDYERRAEPVRYCFMSEDGVLSVRVLSLPTFARLAFAGKTATKEQREAFAAALAAVERFQKANVEKDSHEGLKEAAAALTALAAACGLDVLTTKTNEAGEAFPFFIHRSFVHAAAARMRCRRGLYVTEAAAVNEAAAAAVAATDKNHARAAARLEKANAAAVKMVFSIINEAAAAAVVGVWNAHVLTAAEAEAERRAREEAAAKAAAEREAAKERRAAEREAEKERRAAEREALKAEREAKKAKEREAAAAKKNAAAKTAPATPAKKTAAKKGAKKTAA